VIANAAPVATTMKPTKQVATANSYRVDLYLNDKLDRSLEFSVQ
jgi:hypothetical protein